MGDTDERDWTLTVEDNPAPETSAAIVDGLDTHNVGRVGPHEAQPLLVRANAPNGDLIGGVEGKTYWQWLHVRNLWVHADQRGRGLGSVLLARAENEAKARGCIAVHLDTFSFQARGFYEGLGYAVFGILDDYPPGHRRFYLQKRLA